MGSEEDLSRVLTAIGGRIRARRFKFRDEGREWSQQTIADLAEVNLKQFNLIENARAEPRISTLIKIAGALEIPPRDLIEDLFWVPGENRGFGHMEQAKS